MPYYLAPYIGAGTTADRFRPRTAQSSRAHIDLRPDGGATLGGGGLNKCLLVVPAAESDPQLALIALAPSDSLGPVAVAGINTILGTALSPGIFSDLVMQLLRVPPVNGWKPLRPTVSGLYEIWLGGLLTTRTAFSPAQWGVLAAALTVGRPKVRRRAFLSLSAMGLGALAWHLLSGSARANDFSETWPTNKNPLDSPSTGEDQAWTVESGTFQVTGNHLENTSLVANAFARCNTQAATDNHRVQADYVVNSAMSGVLEGARCRKINSNTDTCYAVRIDRSTPSTELILFQAGAQTSLGSQTADPGATGATYTLANGSTIKGNAGTNTELVATNTAVTGNTNGGVFMFGGILTSDNQIDNWRMFDLGTPERTKMGVGV